MHICIYIYICTHVYTALHYTYDACIMYLCSSSKEYTLNHLVFQACACLYYMCIYIYIYIYIIYLPVIATLANPQRERYHVQFTQRESGKHGL